MLSGLKGRIEEKVKKELSCSSEEALDRRRKTQRNRTLGWRDRSLANCPAAAKSGINGGNQIDG